MNFLFSDSLDALCEKDGLQKFSILRRFCQICGVQLQLKEFALDNRQKPSFSEEDIMNVFPVAKHIHPKASDACSFYTSGQAKIQAGQLRSGFELVNEALSLLQNVYGPMHPEISECLRLLGKRS